MKIGLTLGKYSPLHKGHQELFEIALKENDHLIVVIYNSPETTNIPLEVRANWIRQLYPQIEVIEAWDGPTQNGDSKEIKELHEKYLKKLLYKKNIHSFYSAEFYGDHISKAFNAENRKINRSRINISGTEIRNNIFNNRTFLNPIVYKDYITNIVFLGAPSTGKTSISKELANEFNTVWMPEYGREYWEKNQTNRRLSKKQLLEIAQIHVKKEGDLLYQANRFLFTDTNAITTYMFGKYYHGNVLKELKKLATFAEKRYDIFFLCDDDIPYDDTWDRSGDINRKWFQYQIESDLKTRKIPYIKISGSLKDRIKKVQNLIINHVKYDSLSNKLLGDNN